MRLIAFALALIAAPAAAQFNVPGLPAIYGLGGVTGPNASFGPINPASTALGNGSAGVFDSGNGEGWTVTCPTCTAGQAFTVARQGFNSSGGATSYTDTFKVTNKLRQAYYAGYPNTSQATWPPNANNYWALSDYILATDAPSGFTNNSTLIAPKPVGNWVEYDHQIIPASGLLHAAATFFSRDARQGRTIAAVTYTAADGAGGHTASCTTSTMAVSTRNAMDQNAVLTYECDIDVSTFADNSLVTLNGTAYPWIGADNATRSLSSVVRSIDLAPTGTGATPAANARYFSPRYYLKNTYKAATATQWKAWVCPVVNSGGSCPVGAAGIANGTWSQTAATAAAAPFLTLEDALNRANQSGGIIACASAQCTAGAGLGNGVGYLDGAVIYVAGTAVCCGGTSFYHPNQAVAAVTVTNDPATTATYLTSTGSGANWYIGDISGNPRSGLTVNVNVPTREAAIIFKGINIKRGSGNIFTQTGTQLTLTGSISGTALTTAAALAQTITIVPGTPITGTGVAAGSTVSGSSTTTFTVSPSQTVAAGTVFTVSDHNNVNVIFDNVTHDCNTFLGSNIGDSANLYVFGATVNNCATSGVFWGANTRMLRGVLATAATSSSGMSFDQSFILGSTLANPAIGSLTQANDNHAIIAFNRRLANTSALTICSTSAVPDGAAVVQNVVEHTAGVFGTGTDVLGADAGTANCSNIIYNYNTVAGAGEAGRSFVDYDQTAGVARTYRFWSVRNNILTEVIAKKDLFDGLNQADAATGINAPQNRTGSWSGDNGVGRSGDLIQYVNIQGPQFYNYNYGINAKVNAPASTAYTRLDPLFVLDSGKITSVSAGGAYTAGVGGADLHLQASSPCKANVLIAGLPFTIDGVARPTTNDSCGAY